MSCCLPIPATPAIDGARMNARLDSVSQLVTVIRSQLTGAAQPQRGRRAAGPRQSPGRRYTDRTVPALIELRVGQIAPDDAQRGRKAFRIFLEVVLLTHLGEELMNDPKFYQILDDVQSALEADASSSELVSQAIAHLLTARGA